MGEEELREEYARLGPQAFVANHIIDRVPFVFAGQQERYNHWRAKLAAGLNVDLGAIVLVGSGAVGCSLNPTKAFTPFGEQSDLDVGVVSTLHFDIAWRQLRNLKRSDTQSYREWSAVAQHTKLVYWGCIATNWILHLMPFGAQWQNAALEVGPTAPESQSREINFRVYRDIASLRDYHERNVRKLMG